MTINLNLATRHYLPYDLNLRRHSHQNLKFRTHHVFIVHRLYLLRLTPY